MQKSAYFHEIAWFSIENSWIFITIGFPIENTENFQKIENPRVLKRTFRLEQCVGSDGSVTTMSKKRKSIKIFMVLKDFPPGILFSGVDSIQILKTRKYSIWSFSIENQ